jgi:hypothetical protein
MPKHSLKALDLTTLLVALDHVEEFGPAAVLPDPATNPANCVYLTYIGDSQLETLAARLPHVYVQFKTPGAAGRNKVVRKVFSKPAIWHVLRFAFPDEREFASFVRDLESVDRKYWRLLTDGQVPAKRGQRHQQHHSATPPGPLESVVVPAKSLVALVDLAAYRSFVATDWNLNTIEDHFAKEMTRGSMLAWGTGETANWRIEVTREHRPGDGFRQCAGRVRATTAQFHLTAYEELTMAAQFRHVRLPRPGTEGWVVAVEPGWYDCRVVQLYDPALADTSAVFDQETPHFRLELVACAKKGQRQEVVSVPWFPPGLDYPG